MRSACSQWAAFTKHAALEVGTRNGRKLEGTRETLVTNGIVVLQGDLSLNRFRKVTLLSLLFFAVDGDSFTLRKGENVVDSLVEEFRTEFGHDELYEMLPSDDGSR